MDDSYKKWPLVLDELMRFKDVAVNGDIKVESGEYLRIACPGTNNVINVLGVSDALVACSGGEIFNFGQTPFSFYKFACKNVSS